MTEAKDIKTEESLPKEDIATYCFPKKMAEKMNTFKQRTIYEATMLALVFLMIGIIGFSCYLVFFAGVAFWYKFFAVFNGLCILTLMGGSLIGTYQQYVSFMAATQMIEQIKKLNSTNQMEYVK